MNNIIPAFLCKHCKVCKYNTVAVCEHIIKMLVYSIMSTYSPKYMVPLKLYNVEAYLVIKYHQDKHSKKY